MPEAEECRGHGWGRLGEDFGASLNVLHIALDGSLTILLSLQGRQHQDSVSDTWQEMGQPLSTPEENS